MRKKIVRLMMVFGAMVAFSACSAKTDGGGGAGPVPVEPFDNKITGPSVEGVWTSVCLLDSFEKKYKTKSAEFRGNTIKRTANLYEDRLCQKLSTKNELSGVFRWSDRTSYGGYVVDYKLDLGNGWTSATREEILVDDGTMYSSDFAVGFGTIDKDFPMKKAGEVPSPEPNPAPNPSPDLCSNFKGIFVSNGQYASMDQLNCEKLIWQPVLSYDNSSPDGSPSVFIMDGIYHDVGDSSVKAYFQETSFILDVMPSTGENYLMNFKILKTRSACGISFPQGEKTILLSKVYKAGHEDVNNCRHWEKVK